MHIQMTGLSRWAERIEHHSGAAAAIQVAAQQKVIDELVTRISRIEQRLGI